MSNFHYKKGNIETVFRWDRPCPHVFMTLLRDYFSLFQELQSTYKFYVWGMFPYLETWDIDLCIVGDPSAEIGDAMVQFADLAHDPPYKQLVDCTLYPNHEIFNLVCDFNAKPEASHSLLDKDYHYYKAHGKVMKNGKELHPEKGEQIHDNLWKIPIEPFQKKFLDRGYLPYPIGLGEFVQFYERVNL